MNEQKDQPNVTFRKVVYSALLTIGIKLSEIERDLGEMTDLDLLYRLERVWPTLTQIKTFANFLKDDLGIGDGGRNVIILVDSSDIVLDIIRMHLKEIGSLYLVTTARTFHEGLALSKYYIANGSLAALITDAFISSFDISSNKFERSTSGIELIRQIKKYQHHFEQEVYCAAMLSDYTAYGAGGEYTLYHELVDEVQRMADVCIPRKSASTILTTLIKSNFGKR